MRLLFEIFRTMIKIMQLSILLFIVSIITFLVLSLTPINIPYSISIISSTSMEPTIPTGSIVITENNQNSNIKVGDIIAYPDPNNMHQLILHRVFKIIDEDSKISFITKGDNNPSLDNWTVHSSDIIGKANMYIPNLGYTINYFRTPQGYFIFVVLPTAVILALSLKNIINHIKVFASNEAHKAVEIYK